MDESDKKKTKAELLEELKLLRMQVAAYQNPSEVTGSSPMLESDKNEKLFMALAESMHAVVMIASAKEQKVVYANPAATELTGYTSEELIALKPSDLFTQRSLDKRDEYMAAFLRGEKPPSYTEMEVITKKGETRWLETSWALIDLGKDGLYKVTTSFDITARKLAQRALRDSEKKFRVLADTTTAQITIVKDECFLYANKAALEYYNMTWEELAQKQPHDVLSPSAHEAGHIALEEGGDCEKQSFRFEFNEIGREGKEHWYEVNGSQLELDGDDAYLWTSFDITDHKKTQEELRTSQDKYRAIFETAGTSMITCGDDMIITLANEQFAKLTGYTKSELEGRLPWTQFFSGDTLARMKRYHDMRSVNPSAVPKSYEAELVDRENRVRKGIINVNVVPDTDQRVAAFQDLTELKRAQKQMYRADKMAALGQIIAGVAHEINNPNNFIYFNLPILKKYIDAIRPLLDHHLVDQPDLTILNMSYEEFLKDIFKLIENMEHGSKRITGIVSELRNYVRAGEDADEMKNGEIAGVIDHVMALVGKQVRKTVKKLEVDVAKNLPPIEMNSGKIEQLLINLVINAGQAADKENSWVRLGADNACEAGYITITIEDNGAGIPEENIDQIFEPFFTSKGREVGTGLGLSISHKIVEDHGGSINVESEMGKGTVFKIQLPVAKD